MLSSRSDRNLDHLLYKPNVENPWGHRENPPVSSSVARGTTYKVSVMTKRYERKKPSHLRKNAPFRDPSKIARTCCTKCCLNGMSNDFIRKQREIYNYSYKDVNYGLIKLIKVTIRMSGLRKLEYTIPSLGQVCKTAFKKCFALSSKKLRVLLDKQNNDSPLIEQDLRGRHKNNCRTMPLDARSKVISFIKSFKHEPSHYHRNRSRKKYFAPQFTMRGLWKHFNKKHPDFKSTRLKSTNKRCPISFSCFRNIFLKYLSYDLSFRLPRTDTCQTCEELVRSQNECERTLKNPLVNELSKLDAERKLLSVRKTISGHLDEAELRFACLDYDMSIRCAQAP